MWARERACEGVTSCIVPATDEDNWIVVEAFGNNLLTPASEVQLLIQQRAYALGKYSDKSSPVYYTVSGSESKSENKALNDNCESRISTCWGTVWCIHV